jgi:transcriptional regulator GlxA family with amidase domain
MTKTVAIYIFDDVEVLDFAGPYEVFTTATRMYAREHRGSDPVFSVFTVGYTGAPVKARAGLMLTPDHVLGTAPKIDVLIVPGGVVTKELERAKLIEWIAATAPKTNITASLCTGAFLLAKAGLLDGRRATTHWEDADDLAAMFSQSNVARNVRWVDEGAVVTSGGISAGIDMSLHLVERLTNRALAERTARQMEFEWTENRAAVASA